MIVSPDNRFAYVSSLGSDRVFSFALVEDAAARALEHGETRVPAGFGPRHLQFADDGRTLVCVVSEFQATLATFARDPDTGRLGDAQVSARHPAVELAQGHARPPAPTEPSVWAADLHLTPDERFAYVSERTSSRLLCYRRSEDGTFDPAHATATETQPRGFAIDPSGRLARRLRRTV